MDEPPTGFEPASSWRSNTPIRRSPRVVGKPTARRAMTPGVPCGLKERTVSSTTRLGKADHDSVTDPWLPAMSDTENPVRASPRVLPRGIEPLASSLKNWRLSPTETPGAPLLA